MRLDIRGMIVPNEDKSAYEFLGLESTCPDDVRSGVQKARGEPLEVYIHSGGGDLLAGLDMYAALREFRGDVRIHISYAASAAGVVACAGESDMIAPGLFMVHNVSGGCFGDYHEMDKGSEMLQTANRAVAEAYVQKSGMAMEDALSMMERETWLTAKEAVAHGLVDRLADSMPRMVAAQQKLLSRSVIQRIQNTVKDPLSAMPKADFLWAEAEYQFLTLKGERGYEI